MCPSSVNQYTPLKSEKLGWPSGSMVLHTVREVGCKGKPEPKYPSQIPRPTLMARGPFDGLLVVPWSTTIRF